MQRYDIVVPKKDNKNPEKTYWKNVGTLVRFEASQNKPEGFVLELHMFPDTTFKVFEQRAKETTQERSAAERSSDEDIAAAIPF